MKNCLRKWFRHLLLISITSVGAAAASPAQAHDLPIFDSVGLYNCFGFDQQTWQLDPNLSSIASHVTSVSQPAIDWSSSGWSWCFGDSSNLATVQTEPRQEFSYLGPATSQSNFSSDLTFSHISDSLSPVKDDSTPLTALAESNGSDELDEFQGCEGEMQFDCFPSKRHNSEPIHTTLDDALASEESGCPEEFGCPAELEELNGESDSEDAIASDVPDMSGEATDEFDAFDQSDEAETLVNEEFVEIVPDLPEQELPSFSNMLEAGYSMLPKFSLTEAYSGLKSWVLTGVKPTVQAAQSGSFETLEAKDLSSRSNNDSNYLRSRKLIDDYLDGESFVRDWRNLQLFRNPTPAEPTGLTAEYSWNAPVRDEIARAEPLIPAKASLAGAWTELASAIENFECYWAQETFSFAYTNVLGRSLGTAVSAIQRKTSHQIAQWSQHFDISQQSALVGTLDQEMLGQPLFVIHQLDGKEFLLPAKQAKHWNTVPQLPAAKPIDWQAIVAKSAALRSDASDHRQARANYVEANRDLASVSFGQLSKNLLRSTTVGLDGLADRIHGLAKSIRMTLEVGTQVAELGEGDSVR